VVFFVSEASTFVGAFLFLEHAMAEEIWKDACGYEKFFSVSSAGRIMSKRTGKTLRQSTGHNGYKLLSTRLEGRAGKSICIRAHRLIASTFLPNTANAPCVNHLDGNKQNNHVSNLEWCDYSRNTKHAFELGLINRKPTTLTPKQQKLAVEMKASLGCSNRHIAKVIGVGPGVIHRFVRRSQI
jgi:NUMOD4 motif.